MPCGETHPNEFEHSDTRFILTLYRQLKNYEDSVQSYKSARIHNFGFTRTRAQLYTSYVENGHLLIFFTRTQHHNCLFGVLFDFKCFNQYDMIRYHTWGLGLVNQLVCRQFTVLVYSKNQNYRTY